MEEKSIQAHFTYNLANATVRNWPFPHLYYENVFPDEFYTNLIKFMPKFLDYSQVSKVRGVTSDSGSPAYPDRFVIALDDKMEDFGSYWNIAKNVIRSESTSFTLLEKFRETINTRLGNDFTVEPDALLIRDRTNYEIGPHSDHPRRVVILIIYLPETSTKQHLGTSLYIPNIEGMICPGGPHYNRNKFTRVYTAPYKPNSALAFVKTDNSFHGVEPVAEGEERNIIHYFAKNING